MIDRRDTKRIEINAPVTLYVEGLAVKTQMVNFSDDGALFKIDTVDEEKISTMELGKEATFVRKTKSEPDREYIGEIIRFFFKSDDRYIALRFWDGYRELPS